MTGSLGLRGHDLGEYLFSFGSGTSISTTTLMVPVSVFTVNRTHFVELGLRPGGPRDPHRNSSDKDGTRVDSQVDSVHSDRSFVHDTTNHHLGPPSSNVVPLGRRTLRRDTTETVGYPSFVSGETHLCRSRTRGQNESVIGRETRGRGLLVLTRPDLSTPRGSSDRSLV